MPTLAGRSGIGERGAVKASRAHLRREPREDLRRPAALEMGHRIYIMECRKAPASRSRSEPTKWGRHASRNVSAGDDTSLKSTLYPIWRTTLRAQPSTHKRSKHVIVSSV
jgi:hypothetical protein